MSISRTAVPHYHFSKKKKKNSTTEFIFSMKKEHNCSIKNMRSELTNTQEICTKRVKYMKMKDKLDFNDI